MATMIDQRSQKFLGEAMVWDGFKKLLSDNVIVYNNREIKGKEFDFCLFFENKGILIVEVKGWNSDEVTVFSKDDIYVKGFDKHFPSPKSQANMYRYSLKEKITELFHFTPLIMTMVCYPKISREEYYKLRLDIPSEEEYTLLKDDFENENKINKKINNVFENNALIPHDNLTIGNLNILRKWWEPKFEIKSENVNKHYSQLLVFPNQITENDMDVILNNYRKGVKEILFVSNQKDVSFIRNELNEVLRIMNISPKKGDLCLGFTKGIEGNVNIFNFQVFCCEKITSLVKNRIEIIDGNNFEDYQEILTELGDYTEFNFDQFKIEHAPLDKHILVDAGAGTGKTYSMVSRVAFLCNINNSPISNIAKDLGMVTFTVDAANNMKRRLKKMFTNYYVLTGSSNYVNYIEDIDRASISTIHKFCIDALRGASYYTGLGTNYKISSNEDLRKHIFDRRIDEFIRRMISENDNFINELPVPVYELKEKTMGIVDKLITKSIRLDSIKPSEFGIEMTNSIPEFNSLLENTIFEAEKEYLYTMNLSNYMDLKECIMMLKEIVSKDDSVLEKSEIKYLFIDEFQDTDDVQIDLFKLIKESIESSNKDLVAKLFPKLCRLFIVGDLKQSIYRFRGAKLSAFDRIKSLDNKDWVEYSLTINYRTDKRLLDEFDQVFSDMGQKEYLCYSNSSRLTGNKKFDYKENLFSCERCHGNAEGALHNKLFEIIEDEKKNLEAYMDQHSNLSQEERTIAILVRSNWQIEEIIREANKRDIVVEVQSGGDLFQLDSTFDLYKLVLAITNPNDEVSLVNFIESNYTDLKLDYRYLKGLDHEEKIEVLKRILNEFFVLRMNQTWDSIINQAYTQPILYVLRQIYDGLMPWKLYSNYFSVQRQYMENYEYLIERIIEFFRIDALTLVQLMQYLSINILTGQKVLSRNTSTDQDKGVRILCTTVHKSKGLEYGTVILPYTFDEIYNAKRLKLEANYSDSKLSYFVRFNNGVEEYNSYFKFETELKEQISEEARILYVALTRAIFNCIWIHNVDKHPNYSWGTFMEEHFND